MLAFAPIFAEGNIAWGVGAGALDWAEGFGEDLCEVLLNEGVCHDVSCLLGGVVDESLWRKGNGGVMCGRWGVFGAKAYNAVP